MAVTKSAPRVTIIGGGMITRIQLLPTIYHLQREGGVGDIHICALTAAPLAEIRSDAALLRGFPGQSFEAHPDPGKTGGTATLLRGPRRGTTTATQRHSVAVPPVSDAVLAAINRPASSGFSI